MFFFLRLSPSKIKLCRRSRIGDLLPAALYSVKLESGSPPSFQFWPRSTGSGQSLLKYKTGHFELESFLSDSVLSLFQF